MTPISTTDNYLCILSVKQDNGFVICPSTPVTTGLQNVPIEGFTKSCCVSFPPLVNFQCKKKDVDIHESIRRVIVELALVHFTFHSLFAIAVFSVDSVKVKTFFIDALL